MDIPIMENKSLMECVVEGRKDFFKSYAMNSPLGGIFQKEKKGAFYYFSGLNYAPVNGILEEDSERTLNEEEIAKALAFFKPHHLPFIWWSESQNLEKKGFQFGGILTGIAMDISQGLPAPAPTSCNVKKVSTDQELDDFVQVVIDEFGMDISTSNSFKEVCLISMQRKEQVHFLAYLNGTPVGTSTLSLSASSAGIWNLATRPGHRKQGIGSALVYAALVEAKKQEHDAVMAILMPKGMAWNLFTQWGFKEVCKFPFYIYGMNAADLEK